MGLGNLQERQKETGAIYKLLALIESLEAQHRVSSIVIPSCSVPATLFHSDLGYGFSAQASLAPCMSPGPGLAWPPAFLSPNELAFHSG